MTENMTDSGQDEGCLDQWMAVPLSMALRACGNVDPITRIQLGKNLIGSLKSDAGQRS